MGVRFLQLGQCMTERFGNEAATVLAKMAFGIRQIVWRSLMQCGFAQGLSLGKRAECV
jgi:hypothetical protein